MNPSDPSGNLKSANRVLVLTDLETDDVIALWILLKSGALRNKELMIVADGCHSKHDNEEYALCKLAEVILFCLGEVIPEELKPKDISIVRGEATKTDFPRDYYGLITDRPPKTYEHWRGPVIDFLSNGPVFIFGIKPCTELMMLMSDNEAGKIEPAIDFKQHTAAFYGSFNNRTLFKTFPRERVVDMMHLCGSNFYYETFLAVGEVNNMTPDNAGKELFDHFPDTVKKAMKGWNDYIIEDCKEDLRADMKNALEDHERLYTLLAKSGFEESVLPAGVVNDELRSNLGRSCKIIRAIMANDRNQFVNADTGLAMGLMPEFAQYWKEASVTYNGNYVVPKEGETAEGVNPLYVFLPNDKSAVRDIQVAFISNLAGRK